jgi:hypothetical protein
MSCHKIENGIICLPNFYFYKGFYFEFHRYFGPMKLRKDLEPAARQGMKFCKVVTEWCQLSKKQKEGTRIYG